MIKKTLFGPIVAAALVLPFAGQAQSPPFGSDADAAYAQQLWQIMEDARLVGASMIHTAPYEGTDPHGMMLETLYTSAGIDGHEGALIVKRNYGPAGVSADEVLANPEMHLGAVTIMYRREAGYDPDNKDWFWAKYLPDGSLDKAPNGMRLAGQVAKGADTGCIACHQGAGDDMVFTSDHLAN